MRIFDEVTGQTVHLRPGDRVIILGERQIEVTAFDRFVGWVLLALAIFFAVWGLWHYTISRIEEEYVPKYKVVGRSFVYPSSEIERFYSLPWHRRNDWVKLKGQDTVVTGDLSNASVSALGNLTFKGATDHVVAEAENGMIRVGNTKDSHFTGDDVVIAGNKVNSSSYVTCCFFIKGVRQPGRYHPPPQLGSY